MRIVILALLLLTASAWAQPKPTLPTLPELLKKAELDAIKLENGDLKIPVTIDEDTVVIIGREADVGNGKNPVTKVFNFYTLVATVPKGSVPSQQMLKKVAEINDQLLIGKVGFEDGGFYYTSSLWLVAATPELVYNELFMAHMQRTQIRKILQPYLQEG